MVPTFADAIADPGDQPQTAYRALEGLVRQTIGAKLFTIMLRDPARGVSRRCYSNMPDAYPIAGEKPMRHDRWSETVVTRREIFVANSVAEFADVFTDHELIRSLGCESCLNLPIVVGGEVLGTLNALNGPGHYTPQRVEAAGTLRLPGAAVLMLGALTALRQPPNRRPVVAH